MYEDSVRAEAALAQYNSEHPPQTCPERANAGAAQQAATPAADWQWPEPIDDVDDTQKMNIGKPQQKEFLLGGKHTVAFGAREVGRAGG